MTNEKKNNEEDLEKGRTIIELGDLKAKFKSKAYQEGTTMRNKIIEWIKKYIESEK